MKLSWSRATEDTDVSLGRAWVYLVTGKPGAVTLSRYGAGATSVAAAGQAAQHAIHIHPKAGGDALGSDLGHARKMAQDYEDGETFFGHPAWQHEGDPA